jgi:hypothetical protein
MGGEGGGRVVNFKLLSHNLLVGGGGGLSVGKGQKWRESHIIGCSIAQLVACWPAVRQGTAQIPARDSRDLFPAERKQ